MSTSSAAGLRGLCGALITVTTIITGLRLYARKVQRAHYGPDDWTIIPSYLIFIGMAACALLGVHLKQFGYPAPIVAATHIPFSVEASLVVSLDILSTASLGFARISALLFYRRIFCVKGRTGLLRTTIHVAIVVISLWMVAFIILPPLQCGPNLSVWSASSAVRQQHCSLGNKIVLGFCISDLVVEVVVISLPIPKILGLHTTLKRRLGILCVFLTAFVSLGAVVARLVIVWKIEHGGLADISAANTRQTFMWILEAGFAVIAVNLPSLWWLRQKLPPSKVLDSVRSVISLQSMRSKSSSHKPTAKEEALSEFNGKQRTNISAQGTSEDMEPNAANRNTAKNSTIPKTDMIIGLSHV